MNKNLQLIQMLRGIAALLVVFYHATINCELIFNKEFLFRFFTFGCTGVDIFFVLSGFIITYINYKNIGNPGKMLDFFKRRCVRIFPTYWIIAIGFLLLQLLLPSFYNTKFSLAPSALISTFLLLPGHAMLNGVSWTLTFEMFFYFLFALSFFIGKRISLFVLLLYSFLLIFIFIRGNADTGNVWTDLLLHPMILEFFMGVISAVIIRKIGLKISFPMMIAGSLAFLVSGILVDQSIIPFTANRVLFFGIPSFFIIWGMVRYEIGNNLNIHNSFILLGEASYSLYLVHLPVLVAVFKILNRYKINNTLILNAIILGTIVLICYLSILFYRFIEKPIISKLNSRRRINVANEV